MIALFSFAEEEPGYSSIDVCFLLAEPTFKPSHIPTVEQQRERERQRLRDEDERRKKLLVRKDHQQPLNMQPVPKFEPLVVDLNNDESRANKSKTPTAMAAALTGTFSPHFSVAGGTTGKISSKPASNTPLPRINLPANQDENNANNADTPGTIAGTASVPAKKFLIKKRSTALVGFAKLIAVVQSSIVLFSILLLPLSLISMNSVKRWATAILPSFIGRNCVAVIVNMRLKLLINPR